VLIGVGRWHQVHADRAAATVMAEQEIRLLERLDDPLLASSPTVQLGTIALLQGEIDRAYEYFHRALALSDDVQEETRLVPLGLAPITFALLHSSPTLWLSGRINQARSNMKKSLIRAQKAHPALFFNALFRAALTYQLLREPVAAKQLAHQALTVADECGITLSREEVAIVLTAARLHCGDSGIGSAMLAEYIRAYRATGAKLLLPFYLSLLAEAYWREHNPQEGLQVIAEALQLTSTNLDRFWEAELYRLQGELLLAQFHSQGLGASVPNIKRRRAQVRMNKRRLGRKGRIVECPKFSVKKL
jgi:tetratricopeptide (TPR) repeat protein